NTGAGWQQFLASTLLWVIGINLAVMFVEMATQHPTQDAKATVKMILSGSFAPLFWVGVVVIGNVLPFALLWFGASDFLLAAAVLALLGSYITEHIWVRAPQMIPNS
ncbi:MAG TPA: 4Fe-4S ferredoxin, partial [Bacteroidetes bacterium]|nr:4Fe-4S ferredoxin [Bacteroidota bacterium]